MAVRIPLMDSLPAVAAFLEAGSLAGEWRLALGMEIRAAAAFAPLSLDLLSPGELACYRNLGDASRRRAWLTGRAALRRLGRPDAGAGLAGPVPGPSLAYAAGLAVAVARHGGPGAGLGVDLEAERPMPACLAPAFLAAEEIARLEERADGPENEGIGSDLLRLWTVKEALRKADSGNPGRMPRDYRVPDPGLRRGKAGMRPGLARRAFRYVSHGLPGWRLSLACAMD